MDHHSEYLARAVAALTPAGHERADAVLDELVTQAAGREHLVRFAASRRAELETGKASDAPDELTRQEVEALEVGFMTVRDGDQLDDVADWANAVLALLKDDARR